jgi:hypothetical protein
MPSNFKPADIDTQAYELMADEKPSGFGTWWFRLSSKYKDSQSIDVDITGYWEHSAESAAWYANQNTWIGSIELLRKDPAEYEESPKWWLKEDAE